MPLVTAAQMRAIEAQAVAAGATWAGLMEQAGWGVAQEAIAALGTLAAQRVLVLVGPGNNGGDGLIAARHLHDSGAQVALYLWRRAWSEHDAPWQACRARGIAEYRAEEDEHGLQLRHLAQGATLLLDGLLGAGLTRPLAGLLAAMVEVVNTTSRAGLTLAIDLPTGVDADSGAVWGLALRADCTVATGLVKRGLLLYPGRGYAGRVVVADLGVAAQLQEEKVTMSEVLDVTLVRGLAPTRAPDAHKGTFGKALIVAGSLHYPGAAVLATSAAVRAGAGLVTLGCARALYPLLAARVAEATMLPLPEADWGVLGEEAAQEIGKQLEGYQALLIGPGLGQAEATGKLVGRLLGVGTPKKRSSVGFKPKAGAAVGADNSSDSDQVALPPLVVDADGLNLLAQVEQWWERLGDVQAVLTPHPGEMARLLGQEEIGQDRVQVAQQAAAQWGQVVVLKGAGTVVAAPDGRTAIDAAEGNAALATAGTGDVLAGMIVGLLAQGLASYDAALLGVYLHSAAGARVRDEIGSAGAAASDLLPRIPLVLSALHTT